MNLIWTDEREIVSVYAQLQRVNFPQKGLQPAKAFMRLWVNDPKYGLHDCGCIEALKDGNNWQLLAGTIFPFLVWWSILNQDVRALDRIFELVSRFPDKVAVP